MNAISPQPRAPRRVLGPPQPAVREAREDSGQREPETKRVSALSDGYPAGQTDNTPRESQRSGSVARGVVGHGGAVPGSAPVSVQPRDETFAVVPAKVMEPTGGHVRRVSSRARRDVSLDVRLTNTEREAIRARARVLGVKPSAWARAVMSDALDVRGTHETAMQQTAHEKPDLELARAVEQLRRVGVNLNQALRKGQTVDGDSLRAVIAAVGEVRAALGDRTSA
ncbi:hypothetical protein [Salinibacterium sp. SWN167]|uniref:plasmid mobilization protein n=1 Tax=Salinibacterium sp. SWN167 TaxID=2792054 RepID=UPI0018CF5C03|nr:hypothetical protein [Salinibacterium sp. SWN167]MBH0083009.1 hypothetical protein [Salinibacterium sp. SWN167]